MRSFTKKLAFVMALAMVVTLATPAIAQVSAATTITYAYQNETAVKESIALNVNETVDMCFLGAPKGWRTLFKGWTSADTKIATVDKAGNITGVSAGTTTVKVDLGDDCVGSLQVIVKAPSTTPTVKGFEQVTEKEMKVDLGNKNLTLADVQDKINFYYYIQ
ncbi:MAG: Ig-like domain-containing protein, partial [Lachnospiraceae bacterium]|nr:Ig-like domain-containing protein [Lachnospiraceae bacterium]